LPEGSNLVVMLLGAGPGLNFDFAALSFQVPIPGSVACAATFVVAAANAARNNPRNA